MFGPQRPISAHLADLLEEWHREQGQTRPPCVYSNGRGTVLQWKVFDRQGKQLQLSHHDVFQPCAYQVLVLHRPDSPETLVRTRLPHASRYGSYLVAWLGLSKGFEAQCCAIRMFAPKTKVLSYTPEAWNIDIPDLDPEGEGLKKAVTLQTRPVDQGQEGQRAQGPERVSWMITRSASKSEAVRRRANAQNRPESSDETDSSAGGSSNLESSSSEEEEEEEQMAVVSRAKKHKFQHQSSHTRVKIPRMTNPTKVDHQTHFLQIRRYPCLSTCGM